MTMLTHNTFRTSSNSSTFSNNSNYGLSNSSNKQRDSLNKYLARGQYTLDSHNLDHLI